MDYFSETLSMCSSEQRKLYTHRMALRCKGCIFLCSTLLHFNCCCCIKQMCLPLSFCHCILFSLFNNTTFVFLTKKKQFIFKQIYFALRIWFNMMKQESPLFLSFFSSFFRVTSTFLILEYNLKSCFFLLLLKYVFGQILVLLIE